LNCRLISGTNTEIRKRSGAISVVSGMCDSLIGTGVLRPDYCGEYRE
jgi:hypothetical protein